MVEEFQCEESRIFIFGKPLICHFCSQDVFIPYETYHNVEKPGIKCIFVHNTAICTHCGYVIEFSDPSHFDREKNNYIWAFDQKLIHERPPYIPPIPTLSEEQKTTYKRCIHIGLQLLIQKKKIDEQLLTCLAEQRYFDIAKALDSQFEMKYEHMIIQDCLIQIINMLMRYRYISVDEISQLMRADNDNSDLEQLLRSKLS